MNAERAANVFRELVGAELSASLKGNFVAMPGAAEHAEQSQTNDAFSDKWAKYEKSPEKEGLFDMQKKWYLALYGFPTEADLAAFLADKKVIFDAGCGLGYKAAWFAQLAPESLVVGMDFSDAASQAAEAYRQIPNLVFIKGDIARTPFREGGVDYVSCDQVIMHTQNPDETFAELTRIARPSGGQIACYFYTKKALPRELLDEHFRSLCTRMTSEQLWEMSEQLTELGKRLSELKVQVDVPAIPALGIKGGPMDVQRFIYWNFMKCYWNADLGRETSTVINYDWYSPSNARRYSKDEVLAIVEKSGLSVAYFHEEEACYTGRFAR